MKLRYYLLLSISITLVGLILGINLIASRLVLDNFVRLEQQSVSRDVERVRRTFTQMYQEMKAQTVDWAEWDDTYNFAKDRNQAYKSSNVADEPFTKMGIDTAIFLDTKENCFLAHPVPRTDGLPPPATSDILHTFRQQGSLRNLLRGGDSLCGMMMLPKSPLFFCAMPILPTSGKGQSRGWLLFGSYLDTDKMQQMKDNTRLDIEVLRLDNAVLPADCRQALTGLSSASAISVRPLSEHFVAGYTQVSDVFGKPILLLRVTEPRSIYAEGLASVATLRRFVLVAGIIFGAVILLVLECFALSRLSRLSRQVEQVGDDVAARVVLNGRDELSGLASAINGMLSKLEEGAQTLRESEENLRIYNETLEQMVQERTREIEHQAFHDALTGLPNRALFMNRIEFALSKASRSQKGIAALFLDLDNFKLINDSMGHDAGDRLLHAIADKLRSCVHPGDTVARLGGDEFTLLLEDLSGREDAEEVAERIMEGFRTPIILPQGEVFAGGSLGIAYLDDASLTPDDLMKQADTAMYHAKDNGKSAYAFYEPSMADHAEERMEIEIGLRRALENKEFDVHYQPLIDLQTGVISGAEALARWNHPTRGRVSPGQFIPIAEETGLIVPIGYWILEQACRQTMTWRAEYDIETFVISVNLSGKQLQREDVVERVADILERTGIPPQCLKLEITESVLMADMEDAIAKMRLLKKLGIKLALDDFGTGYSSLSSLSDFPIDTVKIDRAFIKRLGEQDDASSVVEAITLLSRSMSMDVTCEGVETQSQVAHIQGFGCHTGQGYFFASPLTSSEFGARLTDGKLANLAESDKSMEEMIERMLNELPHSPNRLAA